MLTNLLFECNMSIGIYAFNGVYANLESTIKIKLFEFLFCEPGYHRLAHSRRDLLSQHYRLSFL